MATGENMLLGLQTLLLGMAVTFVGLLILQGVMKLIARLSRSKTPEAGAAVAPSPAVAPAAAATDAAIAALERPSRHDEEIAAISAVLAVLTAEDQSTMQVKSIRSVGPAKTGIPNIWGLAGRQEIMESRRRA